MKRFNFIASGILLLLLAGVCRSDAASRIWQPTSGTNDWFDPACWAGQIPTNGDDVTIGNAGAALLTNSPGVYLGSLTLSKTLIFSNWNTTLSATNITIQSGGLVTLPSAFTDVQPSNNIYFVCSNLMVDTGGIIDTDGRGWIGRLNTNGLGPGAGWGGDSGGTRMGAGHGGYGGNGGYAGSTYGLPYDDSKAPVLPGSSGGGGASGWSGTGGNGGGAIRIAASGTVTVDGLISANGGNCSGLGCGGSGGSIYIACGVIAGATGVVRANGGTDSVNQGAGGGGCIAVVYDPSLQAAAPVPTVRYQVAGAVSGTTAPGDIGTLYFPDTRLLTENMDWSGQIVIPGFTNWVVNTLTVSNGWVRFNPAGFNLTVSGDLKVDGTAGWLQVGAADFRATNNAPVFSGGETAAVLRVGGNLTLTNGGCLFMYGAVTNAGTPAFGALVAVTGTLYVASNSWIYPRSHFTNGGSVFFQVRDLTVAGRTGGGFNADGLGWIGRWNTNGLGPGAGLGGDSAVVLMGAGHGGYGGHGGYSGSSNGLPYDASDAPILPGSGGGGGTVGWGGYGGHGGGVIRIVAEGTVTVNGLMSANGGNSYGQAGGGSGGSIFITCGLIAGTTGVIRANGSIDGVGAGNGGGGRIAVVYTNTALQAVAPVPTIQYQVAGGTNPYNGTIAQGDVGTLYFPNTRLLLEDMNWSGQIVIPGFTNWAVDHLSLNNGWVRFPQDGLKLTVSNNLVMDGPAAWLQVGATVFRVMNNTHLFSGGGTAAVLQVGGNVTLTNGACLYLYGSETNGTSAFGALMAIAGDMYVGSNSWVYPQSHSTNGGSVSFQMRNLTIEGTNGGFDANGPRGFGAGISGHTAGFGPGGGTGGGGSYGGLGGGASGPTYGSSNAPADPGSGGAYGGNSPGPAGGLVHLVASRTVTLRGVLKANGAGNSWGGGAGSGGGIYIHCRTFIGSTAGSLQADGGSVSYGSGGGGGGRIAVWRVRDRSDGSVSTSAAGGANLAGGAIPGTTGTIVWGLLSESGTVFVVR